MEIKKAPQADLERGKLLSLLMGLVVAISVVFVALEWRSPMDNGPIVANSLTIADLDNVPIIEDEQPEQPEPEPEIQKVVEVQLPEVLTVVEDEKKIETKFVSADEGKTLPPPVQVVADPEPEQEEEIFEAVEKPAEYPGGPEAMLKYLSKNTEYPAIAQENGIQGRVYIEFVVEKDGTPTQFRVLKSVDPALDKEALRVAKTMKKWIPGEQQGRKVRSKFRLPVLFRLNQQ